MGERHRQCEPRYAGVADLRRIYSSTFIGGHHAATVQRALRIFMSRSTNQTGTTIAAPARIYLAISQIASKPRLQMRSTSCMIPRNMSSGRMSSHIRKAPTIKDTKIRRRNTPPGEPPRKRYIAVSSRDPYALEGLGFCPGAVQWGDTFGAERSSAAPMFEGVLDCSSERLFSKGFPAFVVHNCS